MELKDSIIILNAETQKSRTFILNAETQKSRTFILRNNESPFVIPL